MTGSYNYKTYYIGTPKDLENSSSIVLFMSGDFGGVSLESLSDLQNRVTENIENKPVKTTWKDKDGVFNLILGGDVFEFDTIIYVNSVSGYTGYTIFSGPQRCYSSSGIPFQRLRISFIFSKYEGEDTGNFVEVKTYLDSNVTNTKILGSKESWKYSDLKDIKISEEDGYLKFTNRSYDFLNDKELNIITDSGIITHENGISGLYVLSGIEVDSELFSTIRPIMYKGDIAVFKFSYQTGEYCVSSLSCLNQFGRPYDYLSGIIEKELLPSAFLGYSGDLILFSDDDNYIIYYLGLKKFVKYPKVTGGIRNCIIFDKWDPNQKIRYINETDLKAEISRSCNVPDNFESSILYKYQEKIGDWWIFKTYSKYLYISVYGTIWSNFEINFISNRLCMYIEKDNSKYHFFSIEFGHTYYIRDDNRVLDKISGEYTDIIIKSSNQLSSLPIDKRTFLSGIRKKPFRLPSCLPRGGSILGVGLGMIFYLSDGLLYCY